MILSFRLTQEEFLSGQKTCTRRFFGARQRAIWINQWNKGHLVHDAWSNLPFVKGAHRIGRFKLTCCPYEERLVHMPIEDLEAEGGMCKTVEEFAHFVGKKPKDMALVIRFKLFSVTH